MTTRNYTFKAHRAMQLAVPGQPTTPVSAGAEFTVRLEESGLPYFIGNLAATTAEVIKVDGQPTTHTQAIEAKERRRAGF